MKIKQINTFKVGSLTALAMIGSLFFTSIFVNTSYVSASSASEYCLKRLPNNPGSFDYSTYEKEVLPKLRELCQAGFNNPDYTLEDCDRVTREKITGYSEATLNDFALMCSYAIGVTPEVEVAEDYCFTKYGQSKAAWKLSDQLNPCLNGYLGTIECGSYDNQKDRKACVHGEAGAEAAGGGGGGGGAAGDGCGGVDTSIIKCDAKNGGDLKDNGVWALLLLAINILTAGVGIVAVGGIVYGAVLYTSAGDKAEQVKKAIGVITNVVIGVLAYVAMYALLQFLIPGGVFS